MSSILLEFEDGDGLAAYGNVGNLLSEYSEFVENNKHFLMVLKAKKTLKPPVQHSWSFFKAKSVFMRGSFQRWQLYKNEMDKVARWERQQEKLRTFLEWRPKEGKTDMEGNIPKSNNMLYIVM